MIEISQKIGYNQVRGDYMSIICAVYLPEGIVMAADSRITRTKYWKDEQGARHDCGGAIDILVINKDRAFWYQHKLYK